MNKLRSAIDAEAPKAALICVVSAVRRGYKLAGPRAVVERGVETRQVREHVAPEIGDHTLAERRHEIVTGRGGESDDHDDGGHGHEIDVDGAAALFRKAEINHRAQGERHGERRRGGDGQRRQRRDRAAEIAPSVPDKGHERAKEAALRVGSVVIGSSDRRFAGRKACPPGADATRADPAGVIESSRGGAPSCKSWRVEGRASHVRRFDRTERAAEASSRRSGSTCGEITPVAWNVVGNGRCDGIDAPGVISGNPRQRHRALPTVLKSW